MPQAKKPPRSAGPASSRSRDGRHAAQDGAAPGSSGARDQLLRLLNPLDVVVVTRERLQEVLDEAVDRGRLTRTDATDLVTEIVARGRRTTEDLIGDLDQLLGGPGGRVRREVDRARRATGIGSSFPISGYESMSAAQVQSRLGELTAPELRKVRDYERRNANRKTVLAAVESRLDRA